MRFVVADLWGNVATPVATISILHAPPAASVSNDLDKVGFTVDVTQRLDGAIHLTSLERDATAIVNPTREHFADSA
jgi:hypothetical protein